MRRLIEWTGDMRGVTIGEIYPIDTRDSEYFLDNHGNSRNLEHGEWEDLDTVNHPPHYKSHPSGIECVQVTEHMNFCLGNATKYIWRADEKHGDGGIEDLKKASWYINREIERRTKL